MKFEEIKKIVIAGAGTMGLAAAQIMAEYGYDTVLYNHREPTLEKAKGTIQLNQENLVSAGKKTQAEIEATLSRITYTTSMDCFKDADLVNESIVENMEIKHEFWKKVSDIAKPDCILTTDTSGMSITEIAKAVSNPERFAGMHWLNPPHLIPVIEIIKGDLTSDETADLVYKVSEFVGKVPVICKKDVPGFITNRMQFAMMRECFHIVNEGIASAEDVDKTMKYGFGFRWAFIGPFQTSDFGGVDTFYRIASYLLKELSTMQEPPQMMKELFESGAMGVKAGKGWYDYSNGKDVMMTKYRDECFIKHADFLLEMDKKYGFR